jgi:hypothetical protein
LGGFDGNNDVRPAEEKGLGQTLQAKGDLVGGLGSGSECGLSGGAQAAVGGIEFGGFGPVELILMAESHNAGNAGGGAMQLDAVEEQESAVAALR